jgi:hypothetical protein
MDARPTSAAVLVELDQPAPARLVVRNGDTVACSVEARADELHELVATGLEPKSIYDYTLELGGREVTGTLRTAPPEGDPRVRFLVVGDNRTDAVGHAAIVRAMLERADGADFVLNTGDMVANGAESDDWQELFDVESALLRELPIFPTLGNHELYLRGVGLPSFIRYTRVPDECGGADTYYGFTWGNVRFLVLDSNDDWSDVEGEQRRWLVAQLLAAERDEAVRHVMIALHHGPLSSGAHGGHPDMLSTGVVDLFRDHGVSLVLSGHDHMYERGEAIGVKYIVSGGGGAPLYEDNDPIPHQQTFEAVHHFLEVEVNGDDVRVTAIRRDGSILERCGFTRGERWRCDRRHAPPRRAREEDRASSRGLVLWGGLALAAAAAALLAVRHGRSRRHR